MGNNHKSNIKTALLTELILGMLLLIFSIIYPQWIALSFFIMTAGSVIILYVLYSYMTKQFNDTMEKVDDTIQDYINGQPSEHFDKNEDSLLGKFQMQINRLYDILLSYQNKEKVLRREINKNISNLTHQINTPITNIQMYSSFLSQGNLNEEEQRTFIQNINRQADKLGWLGESFSKISRLETGMITLNIEKNELLSAILPAINQVTFKAKEHQNEIILKGKQALTAFFDKKWTEEVFFNLLDNAVKYSDRGTDIIIEMIPYELYIRVDVKSVGINISKEEQTKIFQRFYRGEQVKMQEGVGLGLYIVRKILEEEKGFIKVETSVNKSQMKDRETKFSVFLLKA